jgi:hypothetical protein
LNLIEELFWFSNPELSLAIKPVQTIPEHHIDEGINGITSFKFSKKDSHYLILVGIVFIARLEEITEGFHSGINLEDSVFTLESLKCFFAFP